MPGLMEVTEANLPGLMKVFFTGGLMKVAEADLPVRIQAVDVLEVRMECVRSFFFLREFRVTRCSVRLNSEKLPSETNPCRGSGDHPKPLGVTSTTGTGP